MAYSPGRASPARRRRPTASSSPRARRSLSSSYAWTCSGGWSPAGACIRTSERSPRSTSTSARLAMNHRRSMGTSDFGKLRYRALYLRNGANVKSPKLTPFSYVILVLVGERGAGPHDLVRMMRDGRIYWTAPESQFYAEPKRLAQHGYLTAAKQPGRTHERTHYTLTDAGPARRSRSGWPRPRASPRIQNEPVVRLLGAEYAERGVLLKSLEALRTELDELDGRPAVVGGPRGRPVPPRDGPAAQPAAGAADRRRAPGLARRGRTRAVKARFAAHFGVTALR